MTTVANQLSHGDIELEHDFDDDFTYDEFDGLMLTEWFDADPGAFVPRSSREGEYVYAHENPGAWTFYTRTDIGRDTALALLQGAVEVEEVRHLPGKHNQKSHGRSGGLKLGDEKAKDLHERLREPDGGFTVNPRNGKDVTKGYAVAAYPERSKEIPYKDMAPADIQSYVDSNKDVLTKDGNMLGGWHDPETGNVWLDVSIVTENKQKAIQLAQKHNQIAIFDLESFESINTGGTGK